MKYDLFNEDKEEAMALVLIKEPHILQEHQLLRSKVK